MTEAQFLYELQEIMQRDDPLTMDMELKSLEEWDSLSVMGVAGFLDRKCGKRVSFSELMALQTVKDLAQISEQIQ